MDRNSSRSHIRLALHLVAPWYHGAVPDFDCVQPFWARDNRVAFLLFFRVGHNEIIGVCRVGVNAEGLGRDHWNEMLAYPRKPIAHWHPLVEVKKSFKEVCGVILSLESMSCA